MSRLILIFDDDLIHHQDFFDALPRDLGDDAIQLHYRPHADDAVAAVRELAPMAVLMDYSMGPNHVSGAQAVSFLREEFDAAALPIVGISSDGIANERMLMAGANAAIVKMAAPMRLPAILAPLLGGT